MRKPPELCVVSRDRGGEYAKAATLGAPQATQCADRFHVVKHLTEATQVLLARCQAEILEASDQGESSRQEPNKALISIEQWRPPEPPYVEKARLARRASRYARYQQAVELGQQGMTPKEIAGRLGRSSRTVQNGLRLERSPPARKRRKKPSSFDAFAPYVLKRWKEGEHKGITLYREIKAQGYTGSERSVYRSLATLKQAEIQAPVNVERIKNYTPTTAVWLGCRSIPSRWVGSSKRIWRPCCEPALRSKEPTTSFKAS
jgi:transposase